MRKTIFLLMIVAAAGCREKYSSPAVSPVTGYLVVEGYINTAGTTTIRLTRTSRLADTTTIYEKKATVSIQSQSGNNYPLTETSNGIYTGSPVLPNNTNYRIRIVTAGKEYLSAYTTPKTTPTIDSINWTRDATGVQIFANAKGTPTQEKYYQWKTEETWEFNSDYTTKYKWQLDQFKTVIGVVEVFPPDVSEVKCWRTDNSNTLLLGTTENLSDNIVHPLLATIPAGSVKLTILYSINVKQYSISKENYDFLERIKKNTEQLGSIFDAQPSEIKGNITCTNTPNEIVIGFVEATQEQEKRIFIKSTDVPIWGYRTDCVTEFVDLSKGFPGIDTTLILPLEYIAGVSLTVVRPACIKCTKRGGTTKKPAFWP